MDRTEKAVKLAAAQYATQRTLGLSLADASPANAGALLSIGVDLMQDWPDESPEYLAMEAYYGEMSRLHRANRRH